MSLITVPFTFTVDAVIVASEHNSCFSTIYSDYNGNILDANISASAAISDSKLAAITTAGKVSGASFTSLSSIPSGAGDIPSANMVTNACVVTGIQSIAGVKTFSSGIVSSVTGNVTGNLTGNVTGEVDLNGGTISNGTLGVNDQLSHSMSNGETFTVPSGYYVNGLKRGSGGEIDTVLYAKL